jgi:predicted GIY-YIG superfamily endonuclease
MLGSAVLGFCTSRVGRNLTVMPERQLHLFAALNPLITRVGEEFFRAVPREPGIYIMTGEHDRVLYVGQSGNLRARLGSYKNAQPDRARRKVIRLIHQVRSITWEKCVSPEAARLRENQLLRLHRPKFNRANVYPRAYTFIWVASDEQTLTLGRTNDCAFATSHGQKQERPGGRMGNAVQLYGAFKSFAVAGYGALLRLLWASLHQPVTIADFPAGLLREKPPRAFSLTWRRVDDFRAELLCRLRGFLAGTSDELLTFLRKSLPAPELLCSFQRAHHDYDLEVLNNFYERSPKRNRALKIQNHLKSDIIAQEKLDDYLIAMGRSEKACGLLQMGRVPCSTPAVLQPKVDE